VPSDARAIDKPDPMRRSLFLAAAAATISIQRDRPAAADCNAPAQDVVITLDVPGSPFQALPRPDGCWIFVSLTNPGGPQGGARGGARGRGARGTNTGGGIAVVRRDDGKMSVERVIQIGGNPTGMQLTHDGHMLVVAAGDRLAFVDAERAVSGQGNAVLGYLDEPGPLGRIYVNVTPDDKYAFVADERANTITIVDLAAAVRDRFRPSAIVGKIPTGPLPISVTFSPDGAYLYTTSEMAPPSLRWSAECAREGANADSTRVNPQGAILVVDVAKALKDAQHSVVAAIGAGCSAVRLVLSPTGDRAYVSARHSNSLMVFDRQKLVADPGHSLIATVPVGTAPVGVAVVDSGRAVVVTNSNRFGGNRAEDKPSLSVIDASKATSGASAVVGSIPSGDFPREMRVTSDGRTLVVTNFGSRTIELVDLSRALPKR
jgi:DNA-binding beta-propeller fold protein YncE